MQAVVTPAAADLGQSGSIFIAALTPSEGWVFLTPQGFVPWSGVDAMPAYFTGLLQPLSVSVLDGTLDLRGYRGTDIFVGYGRSADEMLANRRHVKASTLQGRRER